MRPRAHLALALLAAALAAPAAAAPPDPAAVRALVGDWDRFAELEALGPELLPVLARVYEETPDPAERREIANVFYRLGQESPEAKVALLRDLHTEHVDLRLSVQWALGRVSGDDDVVPLLLAIMREDPNALFRDKAACALASDQIHLDPTQRAALLRGLVDALEDPKPQVRSIALQALRIHTGQTKGFAAGAPPAQRAAAVDRWRSWLDDYERHL
jgi:HEAT repeat protein